MSPMYWWIESPRLGLWCMNDSTLIPKRHCWNMCNIFVLFLVGSNSLKGGPLWHAFCGPTTAAFWRSEQISLKDAKTKQPLQAMHSHVILTKCMAKMGKLTVELDLSQDDHNGLESRTSEIQISQQKPDLEQFDQPDKIANGVVGAP